MSAGDGVPGPPQREFGRDPEDAWVGGAGDGPIALAEDAAAAALDRPVRREVDPDEEAAGAVDVEGEALASDPQRLRPAFAERRDQRLRVLDLVDPPVLGGVAQGEVGRAAEDQA